MRPANPNYSLVPSLDITNPSEQHNCPLPVLRVPLAVCTALELSVDREQGTVPGQPGKE